MDKGSSVPSIRKLLEELASPHGVPDEGHWSLRTRLLIDTLARENVSFKKFLEEKGFDLQELSSSMSSGGAGGSGGHQGGANDGDGGSGDDGANSDDGDDDEPEDLPETDDEECEHFTIFLKPDFNTNRNITYEVVAKPSWKLRVLKPIAYQKWKTPISSMTLKTPSGATLHENLTIGQNGIINQGSIHVSLQGRGGGLSRYMKKDEAMLHVKQKITKQLRKTSAPDNDLKEEFRSFQSVFQRAMDNINLMKGQGTRVIDAGIRNLSSEDLTNIKEIMDYQNRKRRGNTEDKLVKVVSTMFPLCRDLEDSISHLQQTQEKMMEQLLHLYLDEFHEFKDGSVQFDNASFLRQIDGEIHARDRMRQNRGNENASVDGQGADASCVLC